LGLLIVVVIVGRRSLAVFFLSLREVDELTRRDDLAVAHSGFEDSRQDVAARPLCSGVLVGWRWTRACFRARRVPLLFRTIGPPPLSCQSREAVGNGLVTAVGGVLLPQRGTGSRLATAPHEFGQAGPRSSER
jgi:hypothetical protein